MAHSYANLPSKLRDGDRVADEKSRRQMKLAANAIDELLEFVKQCVCECYDEYGAKLAYSDLEGVKCDCDRCELLKQHGQIEDRCSDPGIVRGD